MTETMIIAEAEAEAEVAVAVEAVEVDDGQPQLQKQQQHQHQKQHQKRIVIEDDENELSRGEEVEGDDDDGLPDNMNSSGKSTKNNDNSKNKNNKNCVRFGTVTVRNYGMTLGTNPATSIGSPVCLEWDYEQLQTILIDDYETTKNFGRIVQIQNLKTGKVKNRSPREFYLNYYKRRGILERAGFTDKDFTSMERQIKYEPITT
ncbi:hypothetical protein FRACYDRAFT_267560 [Fragilariopsis cylindrus CCMP1102]|uniref:Uncharacterized protein n=1 Tax=Fragilariopsis cylindrus CCMP1102 TaxID=635003 RepID=A0A1E7FZI5_9STRA|nr:hypothetical protein FRACYDRAFT_267560 [Fragilariopsis cylindrus CCMP1102]|eukprot:OEU23571.1 hypothetical protein FRACYDRAFT_267560 [Fragilariopsis cylindrus CCMP1102]